ncbi:MAG: carboxymuconolactone decarboxylase family protein [ANME-2 cluster archaeon]|nr:carboxymuconolactone decarboxylase family protein [ANME-2 cluster archaeon]
MGWLDERLPQTQEAFARIRETIFKDGALDVKTKELIAIVAGNLMRCEACVRIHSERAKQHGATESEIAEAISTGLFVAAGSQIHWTKVLDDIMK